jgi:dephospho-CoA kinase
MLKIGITGGIGSGKTYVCQLLEKLGYPVFYSDEEAKKLMTQDPSLISEIKQLLGDESYIQNELNKPFIAHSIFHNSKLREAINLLVHPKVFQAFELWKNKQSSTIVFNESALLFETESYKRFDKNILILSDNETRIKRIQLRDTLSAIEIKNRIESQLSDDEKIKKTDFIIDNNENVLLIPQLISILENIK